MQSSKIPENEAPLLEIRDLHTYFFPEMGKTVKAVEGMNLKLFRGEVLGMVGESGCGKSLTALSVLRILPPAARITQGEIKLEGQDLLGLNTKSLNAIRGKKISMIFQEPSSYLNPVLTVGYQIAEAWIAHSGKSRKQALQKTIQILKEMGDIE